MPQRQRDANRPTGVAGCGLNPDLLERSVTPDAAVADAVERDAARETQIAQPGLPARERRHLHITFSGISCIERARSISRWVKRPSGSRGGPPKSRSNRFPVM